MANETFQFSGKLRIQPPASATDFSANPILTTEILETMSLARKVSTTISLDADSDEAVNFGDLASASVVMVKTTGKVKIALTSADGSAQIIPVDKFMLVLSESTPFTAMVITRVSGTVTMCRVILGQVA